MLRKCVICGKEFNASGSTKTCSEECRYVRRINKKYEWRYSHTDINRLETKTCVICGKSFVPSQNSLQVTCSDECRKIHNREKCKRNYYKSSKHYSREEWLAIQRQRGAKQREETKLKKKEQREQEKKEKIRTGICIVCGKEFTTLNPAQVTCSSECGKRWKYHKKDRRTKGKVVDNDITLEALYNRDSGVCYLCGCKCNWDDKTVTSEGYTITGPTYPTIEHVLPLAMGGLHSWKNIRLACFKCNSTKGATVPEGYEAEVETVKTFQGNRKNVTQYTREGLVVATFESTVEAERITGIKKKGIQNCARGECKSYGGYLWKYGGV